MAEDKTPTPPPAAEPPKKRFPMKTLIILAGVLVMEIVTVMIAFSMAGGPKAAHAEHKGAAVADESNKEVEELILEDRFANSRRGDVYLYDTQIYLVVRKKHQTKAQEHLKGLSAQIRADVATIFRRADPSFMHEDELQTLTRQIKAVMDDRFGRDADGKPVVERVLITRCTEYRIEF